MQLDEIILQALNPTYVEFEIQQEAFNFLGLTQVISIKYEQENLKIIAN